MGRIGIGEELSVDPVMTGREGKDRFAQAESPFPVFEASVIQGTDPDRVAGGDHFILFSVIENQGKLGVEGFEHFDAVFMIQRKKNLTVGFSLYIIVFHETFPQGTEAVQLAVAYNRVLSEMKGLHAALIQSHDCQTVETEDPAGDLFQPAHVRTPGDGAVKAGLNQIPGDSGTGETEDGTHTDRLLQMDLEESKKEALYRTPLS